MSTVGGEKIVHPASEVRRTFLEFFGKKGHEVCASGPLVPANDPTLMFANAGMVQFKDVFTGKDVRPYKRATSSQKCIRISGKHNDLENVGVTARHHTFFEMLGNFSFGDYFKEEAIAYAWDLLTNVYGLPKDRLVVSVFGGEGGIAADDEARSIWRKVTGFSDERIFGLGMKDNFWQMGDTGPCGPCSEIHYYLGDKPDLARFNEEPNDAGHGWMEIWNLVFMQFERSLGPDGQAILAKLPAPCVDTGMGLERIASVLQGKFSNYDSDLMRALVDKAAAISGKAYRASQGDDDVSMRVIADHARTTAFLMAEGVQPDRNGREYVLRRVMRRAIRHGHRLGIERPFLHEVALEVVALMGEQYPELVRRKDLIATQTEQEEVRFRQTLERGLHILDEEIATVRSAGANTLPGPTAFKLYDTYGFPVDLTEVIAAERGIEVDKDGYEKALKEQRVRSQESKLNDEAVVESVWREAIGAVGGAVRFTGYDHEEGEGKVVAIVLGNTLVPSAKAGDAVAIITDVTPFYGEAGGQVGDRGVLRTKAGTLFTVEDTQKPIEGLIAHRGKVTAGEIKVGDAVALEVDHERRTATRRNHSATHLLHWALRQVIGEQAAQKGSLVGPDRLRFDFSHGRAVTPEEITRIEDLVNAKILTDAPVETEILSMEQARAKGAIAIFEEKYGDVVRVLTMTRDSVELCGGTHAHALGEIGLFKILSEGGVAAGVRRLEAATGLNALAQFRQMEKTLRTVADFARSGLSDVADKVEKLAAHERQLQKEVQDLKRKIATGGASGGGLDELTRSARDIAGKGGGKVLAVKVDTDDPATLREMAEKLRDKLGEAVVLVGAVSGPKASLVLTVSKSLLGRYKAGELIRPVAEIVGGKGGGRPDMAQAGGTVTDKLDEALSSLYTAIA
ncbi:alanine--tRNA ligase [Pendulispora rubella]|uniref:Alanine--tRNA ligase n=1 Tax=Pendulispora rubella TaxID=2741070 RepID=A0ABZ2LAV5_9BACT